MLRRGSFTTHQLHFLVDLDAAWNDGARAARLELAVVAGGRRQRVTLDFEAVKRDGLRRNQ